MLGDTVGRSVIYVVSRTQPVPSETRIHSQLCACWMSSKQSGSGTGFYPSSSAFLCRFFSSSFSSFGATVPNGLGPPHSRGF